MQEPNLYFLNLCTEKAYAYFSHQSKTGGTLWIRYLLREKYKVAGAWDNVDMRLYEQAEKFVRDHKPEHDGRVELSDVLQTVH